MNAAVATFKQSDFYILWCILLQIYNNPAPLDTFFIEKLRDRVFFLSGALSLRENVRAIKVARLVNVLLEIYLRD